MIIKLSEKTNYWLVRTVGGSLYEEFVSDSYIAIGYNEVNDIDLIKESVDKEESYEKVIELIKSIPSDKKEEEEKEDRKRPGIIYGNINRFINEMSVGDYVLIPSRGSKLIEFGIIESEAYIDNKKYYNIEDGECDFRKRRKVEWLYRVSRPELDPYLYGLLNSHHTISSANDYAHYIDRTLHGFFVKNDQAHLILRVQKKSEIYGVELLELMQNCLAFIDDFNSVTDNDLNKREIQIKVNVQSPGPVEFFGAIKLIAVIGLGIVGVLGGRVKMKFFEVETPGMLEYIKEFIKFCHEKDVENHERKTQLMKSLIEMKVKLPKELGADIDEDEEISN